MKLARKEVADLVFIDKPSGFSTHGVDQHKPGIAEIHSTDLGQKLFVVHRLDKTTSGAMVLAKTAEAAARLFTVFKEHQAKKKYWFLTAGRSEFAEAQVLSLIEKRGLGLLFKKGGTDHR